MCDTCNTNKCSCDTIYSSAVTFDGLKYVCNEGETNHFTIRPCDNLNTVLATFAEQICQLWNGTLSLNYVETVALNVKVLEFTGVGLGFNSTVDFSAFALLTDITSMTGLYLPLAGGTMTGDILTNSSIKSTLNDGELYFNATEVVLSNDNHAYTGEGLYLADNYLDIYTSGYGSSIGMRKIGTNNHIFQYTSNVVIALSDDINDLALTNGGLYISGTNTSLWNTPGGNATASLASNSAQINASVLSSVALGGQNITAKTNYTAYANQISLQPSANLFDGLIVPPALSADRTYSLQNASGTLAFLSDIASSVALYLPLTGGTITGNITTNSNIKATAGGGQLTLRDGADNAFSLSSDNAGNNINSASLYGLTGSNSQLSYQIAAVESIGIISVASGVTPVLGDAWSVVCADVTTVIGNSGTGNRRGVFVGADVSTIAATIVNTVVASGTNITATLSNSLYANQLVLQASANAFDGIFSIGTLTAARTYTMPDRDVTVASSTGVQESTTVTTSSGAGAIGITGGRHDVTLTATGDALTLADGSAGQQLDIVCVAETLPGDTGILTPTTLLGYTTITFNVVGDSVRLSYGTGGWAIISAQGVTLA